MTDWLIGTGIKYIFAITSFGFFVFGRHFLFSLESSINYNYASIYIFFFSLHNTKNGNLEEHHRESVIKQNSFLLCIILRERKKLSVKLGFNKKFLHFFVFFFVKLFSFRFFKSFKGICHNKFIKICMALGNLLFFGFIKIL